MPNVIKIYRDGTLVNSPGWNDPTDSGGDVPVNTSGWTPGTYIISATRTYTGQAESTPTIFGTAVVVNSAAGSFLDDFNRADGALGGSWTTPIAGYEGVLSIQGNKAAPNNSDWGGAVWAGAALNADREVICKLGPGHEGYGLEVYIKHVASFDWGANRVVVKRYTDSAVQQYNQVIKGTSGVTLGGGDGVATTDPWIRVLCAGMNVIVFTSANGTTWTFRHCFGVPGIESLVGGPAIYAHSGLHGGTAAEINCDFISGQNLDASSRTNLVTRSVAVNVGVAASSWTVDGGSGNIITPGQSDPKGGSEAVRHAADGTTNLSLNAPAITGLTPGQAYTMSAWIKRISGTGQANFRLEFPTNGATETAVTRWATDNNLPAGVWTRHSWRWVQGSDTSATPKIQVNNGALDAYWWGLKIEASDFPSGVAADI